MKAYLILANGTVFEGESVGMQGEAIGEVVCTTTMAGYVETITDPSYYGQLVAHTFPIIGNYGVAKADSFGKPALSGYIVREMCNIGSNFRKDIELNAFLKENSVVGICDIDTRQLTRVLRDCGVMNGMISYDRKNIEEKIVKIKAYKIKDAAKSTCGEKEERFNESGKYSVCLWDFGASNTIVNQLIHKNFKVIKLPYTAKAEYINSLNCDGIVLGNGGGDPSLYTEIIEQIALLNKKTPLFAINLGHQLLALSCGAKTVKLKLGHRGGNVPVKDLKRERVYITNQNHGYVVNAKTLPENCEVTFINANDKTVEGIDYKDRPAFSVQFNPEDNGLSVDVNFFDKFEEMMRGAK